MLVLTRKTGQSLYIDKDIVITITRIEGNRVKVGIEAPMECSIVRGELKQHEASHSYEAVLAD